MKTIMFALLTLLASWKISYGQLSTGLVAHYPFGGTTTDASGYGNDGIISGTVTSTADRFGSPDCAYEFGGDTGSYIRVPFDTSLAYTGDGAVSISLWYQGGSPNFGDFECLWGQWTGTSTSYMLYLALYDVNRANFDQLIWEDMATTDTAGVDWHHLVGIYDDGDYALYKDNVLVGTYSGTPVTPLTNHFIIGRTFHGKIDDIRIYNRAITVAEIDSIFDLPSSCATMSLDEPLLSSSVIYPNPTTGMVQIKTGQLIEKLEVSVFDITGRQVLKKSMVNISADAIDISNQPSGIYIIKLNNGQEQKTTLIQKIK